MAAAARCAALHTSYDINEPGPSYADSCELSPSIRTDQQTAWKDGSSGKKSQRVTINDTNPTYHRSGGRTKPKDVIISVREKHGSFRAAVPCMPTPVALICCLLNIVAPGTGETTPPFVKQNHSIPACAFLDEY